MCNFNFAAGYKPKSVLICLVLAITWLQPGSNHALAKTHCTCEQPTDTEPDGETTLKGVEFHDSQNAPYRPVIEIQQMADQCTDHVNRVSTDGAKNLATQFTACYVSKGYLTSRATYISFENGVLKLEAIEGDVQESDVSVEPILGNTTRLRDYIKERVLLGISTPLKTALLEDQLLYLNNDESIEHLEASLVPGGIPGLSQVAVEFREADRYVTTLTTDNYSPDPVGSQRIGLEFKDRFSNRSGDSWSMSVNSTNTRGLVQLQGLYKMVLDPMDSVLMFSTGYYNTRITDSGFGELDLREKKSLARIKYRKQLQKSLRAELAVFGEYRYQDGQTFVVDNGGAPFGLGADEKGKSTVSALAFGVDIVRRLKSTEAVWGFNARLNVGVPAIFNATKNSGTDPDSQFTSLLLGGEAAYRWSEYGSAFIQLAAQLSFHPLLASEKFTVGGGQSVRGFSQNSRSADNGIRLSLGYNHVLRDFRSNTTTLSFIPFVDIATLWNHPDTHTPLDGQPALVGAGLGIKYESSDSPFSARFDLGYPVVDTFKNKEHQNIHSYLALQYKQTF